ncbi:MAG: hypothetical protein QOE59_4851, partial [Actinomycetota bacterium]|nr:hypothetical protein [Actinomycetota bacterium]
ISPVSSETSVVVAPASSAVWLLNQAS